MTLSLASIVVDTARVYQNETALINHGETWTYGRLSDGVRRVAAHLKSLGVGRGDTIALMCDNRPEFTLCYYGVLASGATLVTLNTLLVTDEVAFQLENCGAVGVLSVAETAPTALEAVERLETAKWVILANREKPKGSDDATGLDYLGRILDETTPLESYEPTCPDDTAVVMYTSGTTGHPKGAELTHFNLWENARQISERLFAPDNRSVEIVGPGQVAVAVLPLYHTFGQTCVQNALLFNGGAVSYLQRFEPEETAHVIERDRVTILDAVPTIYNGLLLHPGVDPSKLQHLDYGVSGGAALPVEVRVEFEKRFNMELQEGYGLTETSPVASAQVKWRQRKIGSIGRPIFGCEMKIFDENDNEVPAGQDGEVVIRGRNVMKGYLNQPEATAKVMRNDWFHSGDMGRMDEDGDFYIVDRIKDLIIRGGFNVYPREVEEVLYAHPAVEECCVIGVPDPHYGEEVSAVVTLRSDAKENAEEIIEYCKEHVAAYKYPREVRVVDEIPKGPTGKILKRKVKEMIGDEG